MIQDENNRLSQELENNHKDQGDLEMLTDEHSILKKELEELKESEITLKEQLSREKAALQLSIHKNSALVAERDQQVETLKSELVTVREESASIKMLQNTVQALEQDKANLQDLVKRLEKDLRARPDNINQTSGDAVLDQLREDKETAESQVCAVALMLQKTN
ncbi:hypothetical protein XENORESO_009564 [Xenotaenia resolanae]|uniref:Uncharacterized protein n=1 Tax=Xenotaenia resolanae TaxID=208358 RepID=A0ABV0VQ45_9TELE